ncbi:MAG: type II/IV secretion system protein [Betaproteobacteria bacterium]|nr:type II/IV secretion system protein [Betaproteobacteria bacterium]
MAAILPPTDIRRAAELAHQSGQSVFRVLEEQHGLSAAESLAQVADLYGYPVLSLEQMLRLEPAFDLVPFAEAAKRQCAAFRDAQGKLVGALTDPTAMDLQEWAETRARRALDWHLADHKELAAFLARTEESLRALEIAVEGVGGQRGPSAAEEISLQSISEASSAVVKLVNSTLYDALKAGASDIHLETVIEGMVIKYRIDGVLSVAGKVGDAAHADQVISRVKVMSELDIAERRVPQDGRFKAVLRGREIDFRVSIMPSIFGEDAVIRILDKESLTDRVSGLRLDKLGFEARALSTIRRLSREPYGMLLVTGPTGSGKTTTLYAALTEINSGEDKIVTIEDPVEYQLPGVLQIPVNEKKGLTFARGLRSILRHDPDKIMVGEIRDPETAQIAIQSALTGHLVFTTVHANNVFDVIGRMIHMGIDPYSFVSALNGIIAQRLVRLVCPTCAEDERPDGDLLAASGLTPEAARGYRFRTGRGCGQCRGSGYRGRKAIAEYLVMNDELRELIVSRESIRGLKAAAAKSGTRLLREAALELVKNGEATLQEVNRVTFVS